MGLGGAAGDLVYNRCVSAYGTSLLVFFFFF